MKWLGCFSNKKKWILKKCDLFCDNGHLLTVHVIGKLYSKGKDDLKMQAKCSQLKSDEGITRKVLYNKGNNDILYPFTL